MPAIDYSAQTGGAREIRNEGNQNRYSQIENHNVVLDLQLLFEFTIAPNILTFSSSPQNVQKTQNRIWN